MTKPNLLRMDNVGIVVESLDDTIAFFTELGLTLEGRGLIEGEWAGRITGLGNQTVEIAMMVTPDGHSRLELCKYITPKVIADHRNLRVFARHVCRGRHRRYTPPPIQTRCPTGRRSGSVPRCIPTLLYPRPRRYFDRYCRAA